MRIFGLILLLLISASPATRPVDAPAQVKMKLDAVRDASGIWSCFLTVLNLSGKSIHVPAQPTRIVIKRRASQHGNEPAPNQVVLQRVKGMRQLAPNEGFVVRLPVDCSKPGTYDLDVRLGGDLELHAAVTVPEQSTN